jgi:hypothetical protein
MDVTHIFPAVCHRDIGANQCADVVPAGCQKSSVHHRSSCASSSQLGCRYVPLDATVLSQPPDTICCNVATQKPTQAVSFNNKVTHRFQNMCSAVEICGCCCCSESLAAACSILVWFSVQSVALLVASEPSRPGQARLPPFLKNCQAIIL